MKIIAFIFFGICAVTSAFAGLPFVNGDRIAFFGDSITQNGSDDPRGWVNIVESRVRKEVEEVAFIHAGIGGNTSADMLKRINADVIRRKPTWVFFSCGVNDSPNPAVDNPGVPLDKYIKNISTIFDRLEKTGAKIVVLSQTPVLEDDQNYAANINLVSYNSALKRLALERRYIYLDPGAAVRKAIASKKDPKKRELTYDGTHLSDRGNSIFAQTVLEGLEKLR
jgi:lysophospholipase L1-like esterase